MKKLDIVIVTPINRYYLKDLNIKGIPNLEFLKNLDVDTKESGYLKDPQQFIKKLKSDFKWAAK